MLSNANVSRGFDATTTTKKGDQIDARVATPSHDSNSIHEQTAFITWKFK